MVSFTRNDLGAIVTDKLWAYQAVVLPGGQIILGRWWDPLTGTGDFVSFVSAFISLFLTS